MPEMISTGLSPSDPDAVKPIYAVTDIPPLTDFPVFRRDLTMFVDMSQQALQADIAGSQQPDDTQLLCEATRLPFSDLNGSLTTLQRLGYGIHLIGQPDIGEQPLQYYVDTADLQLFTMLNSFSIGSDAPEDIEAISINHAAISEGNLRLLGNTPTIPECTNRYEPLPPIPYIDPQQARARAFMSGTIFATMIDSFLYRDTLPKAMAMYEMYKRRGHHMLGPEELEGMASRTVTALLEAVPDLPPPGATRSSK